MSERREKALIAVALLGLIAPTFFGVGGLIHSHVSSTWLSIQWDATIPLVPAAVWLYLSWYIAPFLLLAAQRNDFRRAAIAIAIAFSVCVLCYILFPVYVERPLIEGRTASERALLLLYRFDPPWNIFPSFHAALCAILWRPAFGGRVTRAIMPIWMSLICAACVLTKQHQILDVAAGLVAGFAAIWAVKMFTRSRLMKRPRLTISMQYARAQGLPISIPPRANIERDGQ